MKYYKTRTGVVLSEIAGEYVLVAAKTLLNECPYLTQINESSAFLWRQMEDGASLDMLFKAVEDRYDLDDPAEAHQTIIAFVQQMEDMKYLDVRQMEDA